VDGTLHDMQILVSLPVIDEEKNLEELIPLLMAYEELTLNIVDDNSLDRTSQLISELQFLYGESRIRYTRNSERVGFSQAHLLSFQLFKSELDFSHLLQIDGDLSHQVSDLNKLLHAGISGADLVIGSRYILGGRTMYWPFKRLLVSKSANYFVRLLLRTGIRDNTSGYRLLSRDLVELILDRGSESNGYIFQVVNVVLARDSGMILKEVPITFVERFMGHSKMSLKHVSEGFLEVIKLRLVSSFSNLNNNK
jgi:dolichol-phosphate mannosyltransferase